MSQFHVGDNWWGEGELENPKTGAPAVPTTVTGKVIAPSGKESTITLSHTGTTGNGKAALYEWGPVPLNEPGWWTLVVIAAGSFVGVHPTRIQVNPANTP